MKPRAWPLLVVSSVEQRESLDDYLVLARDDAARNGWQLERESDFRDVATGKKGVREPVLRLVAALKETPEDRRPAWIWMRRVDRVGRGRASASTETLHLIRALGARIWDHDKGEVKLDTALDEIVANVMAGLGRLENEVKSGKVRASYELRRKAGHAHIGNTRPYGLRRGPNGTSIPIADQARAVKAAYDWRLAGAGDWTIAKRLTPIAPPRQTKHGEKPAAWTSRRVASMLANVAYRGTVVDELTWHRAQRPIAQRPPRKYGWPLGGVLTCTCGHPMFGSPTVRGGKLIMRYYRCDRFADHGGGSRYLRAEPLEAAFGELVARLAANPRLVARYARAGASASDLVLLERARAQAVRSIAATDRKRDALLEAVIDGTLRGPSAQPKLDQIEDERRELVDRLGAIDVDLAQARGRRASVRDAEELVARACRLYPKAPAQRKNEIARAFVAHFGPIVANERGRLVFAAIQRSSEGTAIST